MNSTYLEFLYNLGQFNIKLGLSTIRSMLDRMGNPHHHPRIIHIAGTNGKGSTLATLERLLLDSGYRTGSTISPHLINFNERFRICGVPVSDSLLEQAFEEVCRYCEIDLALSKSESRDGSIKPTFFEFAIAIAFEIFRAQKVEYILLETGLGGRLDATNAVETPLACILTSIGFDHQEFLGETLEEITREKLGIIKKNTPVFVAQQRNSVMRTIQEFCLESKVDIKQYPIDFFYENSEDQFYASYKVLNTCLQESGEKLEISVKNQSLVGEHQKQNTATALAVYHSIVPKNKWLSENQIRKSLQNVFWRGRLEYLNKNKTILIDGAHNESAIKSLMEYLRQHHSNQRIVFVIAWKKDKQIIDAIDLKGLSQVDFLPVVMQSEKALLADNVARLLSDRQFSTMKPLKVKQLIDGLRKNLFPGYDLMVVAGSLYLIGEFLEEWHRT